MRASWKPLIVGGAWNPELRRIAREASGVYVVRRISDRVVLYVGMSEQGVMWKTLQRHFQAWKTLPDLYWSHDGKALVRGRETFQHARPELLEAAIFVTSTGKRSKKDPDRAARDLEQSMIRRYAPIVNVDPGHAWDERSGAPISRTRAPRKGAKGATRDEAVPDEEIENDAAEPDGPWEDTSDDPDDPFAARANPAPKAHHMKRNPPRAPKRPTFATKRAELLEALRSRGWSVESNLKTPHATNADGDRLWFRSQAIYLGHKSSGERAARSLVSDMREVSADEIERLAQGSVTPAMPAPPPRAPWQEIGANKPHEMFPRGAIDFVAYVDRAPMHALAVDDSPIGRTHLYVETAKGKGWIAEKPARGRWPARYVVTSAGSHALGTFDSDDRSFGADARAAKDAARRARVEREAAEAAAAAAKRAEEDAARAAAAAKPEGYGVEERGKGRTGRGAGQLRMFNPPRMASAARPRGRLVELGALTEIVTRGATGHTSRMRWALRSAPILAYDTAGRLFVVYPTNKGGRATAAARKSYARTHWGQTGQGREVDGAIVVGSARVLGVGVSVTYTTRKGADAEPVDYVHEWGEGASGPWTAPLVVHDGTDPKVAFSGGTYRVTERGIVG